ncbi:pyridoxal phosphate-dependent transferase [Phlebopus sp. FC_14]|nr:pyridoxal phosphate-dependent transferase [Phlebopus sp. FC_14]
MNQDQVKAAVVAIGSGTLGRALPLLPHAISVSLPNWKDNVGYVEGDKSVLDAMSTGYPRFFIHRSIQKLSTLCEQSFGMNNERCLLFPSRTTAGHCMNFILDQAERAGTPTKASVVRFDVQPVATASPGPSMSSTEHPEIYIVLFPVEVYKIARQFWQHSGLGISSRVAELCLSLLVQSPLPTPSVVSACDGAEHLTNISDERGGRNLPSSEGLVAKFALRRRIASLLVHDDVRSGSSLLGCRKVTEDDVFLFPCGMAAIWNAHQLLLGARHPSKSVVFGFPYTDTLKIVEKVGPGAYFYGHGRDTDIDDLEKLLVQESTSNPSVPPILSLFTECPSNPHLRVVNMPRLRALADKFDFLIVVDDTVGTFANVNVLSYADIVVTSLSKFVGGYANALGGSLVLNPSGRHYTALKEHLAAIHEDNYFDDDVIAMERNSRDFAERMQTINNTTESICDFLHPNSIAGGSPTSVIKRVWYPKYISPTNYSYCRLPDGGYGGLFSLTFTSLEASKAFYDALPCAKGPSLGTNFTLSCPYTILAHYAELDWAGEFGVDEGLVRISVGTEDKDELLGRVQAALKAAGVWAGRAQRE